MTIILDHKAIFILVIFGILCLILSIYYCFYMKICLTSIYKNCKNKIINKKPSIYIDIDNKYRTFDNIANTN